jgi:hypothetical protein
MAGDNKVGALPLFFCWALTAVAFVAKTLSTAETIPLILDTDDAMRLTMVYDLLAGQGWFDLAQHRLNTPYGGLLHCSCGVRCSAMPPTSHSPTLGRCSSSCRCCG